jgi:hypothetical protein
MRFSRLLAESIPPDAVVVSVFERDGETLATVDRSLLVVHGAVSPAEHEGPLTVPAALAHAAEIVEVLRPYRHYEIAIRVGETGLWQKEWGTLEI